MLQEMFNLLFIANSNSKTVDDFFLLLPSEVSQRLSFYCYGPRRQSGHPPPSPASLSHSDKRRCISTGKTGETWGAVFVFCMNHHF